MWVRRSGRPSQDPGVHDSSLGNLRTRVKRVTRLLEERLGAPQAEREGDPLDTLIRTILSQNTNDRNRDRAYDALKERFPRWEDVLHADLRHVIRAIRPGGLAAQKATRIKAILRWIEGCFGELSLAALERMDSEAIKTRLEGLKGIGPKTVHCLLLFGLGREAFPVDTHVLRVGKRLGLIPDIMNAEKAHSWMAGLVPEGKSLSLHVNLIQLGRSFCRAIHPLCSACFLRKECPHAR
jgi:endonuclease III